jgi:outer membrane immunogenic protein
MTKLAILTLGALLAVTGSAAAADLTMTAPPAPAMAAPSNWWDGAYIGAFAAYGWGTVNVDPSSVGTPPTSYSDSGFQLGVQGGYNFHLSDSIVAGVGADLAWDHLAGTATIGAATVSTARNWSGSLTGRIGVDLGNIVPYLVGGVAFVNNTATVVDGLTATANVTHTGYTVGAGVEFALADKLSANVEYRYSNYGTANYTSPVFPGASIPANMSDSTVRFGVNYHF